MVYSRPSPEYSNIQCCKVLEFYYSSRDVVQYVVDQAMDIRTTIEPFDEASRAEEVAAHFARSLGRAATTRHARGGAHAEPLPAVLRSKPSTMNELPALAVKTRGGTQDWNHATQRGKEMQRTYPR